MEEQKELLDRLMGINRNNDRNDEVVSDFRDDRVCKFYLRGVCPHDMFVNTKVDIGPCKNLHSDELKAKFEKCAPEVRMYDIMIERDFTQRIADLERSIRKSHARLEEEKMMEANPESNTEVIGITAEMHVLGMEVEELLNSGDIDKALEISEKMDSLMIDKQSLCAKLSDAAKVVQNRAGVDASKKLRVCDVCGSLLSILDSDKRLADHFLGKQHTGFQVMRDAIESVSNWREERKRNGDDYDSYTQSTNRSNRDGNSSRRDNRSSREGNRDRAGGMYNRERSSSRERDRHRYRDRDRDRDRDRYRDINRDRDRELSRERDRSRGGRRI